MQFEEWQQVDLSTLYEKKYWQCLYVFSYFSLETCLADNVFLMDSSIYTSSNEAEWIKTEVYVEKFVEHNR